MRKSQVHTMEASGSAGQGFSVAETAEKLPIEELTAKLDVQVSRGLSSAEAQSRLAQLWP
jgi:hypothetical protein